MISVDSVLVVEDSRVLREVLLTVLAPHVKKILTAATCEEGLDALDESPDLALVLADVNLPDGTGFDVLAHARRTTPEARVFLMSARWETAHAARAEAEGAIGYLAKPLSLRDIARVLRRDTGAGVLSRPARRRSMGLAYLREPDGSTVPHLAFDVRDLSISGAFLETKGPIPVGTRLDLTLMIGGNSVCVAAEVVRIQEPSWACVGGVGLRFRNVTPEAQGAIHHYIHEGAGETF